MEDYPKEMEKSILHFLIPSIYSLFIGSLFMFVFNLPFIFFGLIAIKLNT